MPRAYQLGKRAEQKEATRAAIVQAAIDLYTEQGISHTSMADVARRADVAPGTVLNHFPTRDALDGEIVTRAFAELQAPDTSIYDGLSTIGDRVLRLSQETGGFLDRSIPWYRMWQRDPMVTGAWADAGADYGRRWDELMRGALGSLADDVDAMVMLRAAVDPHNFEMVREGYRSTTEAAELIAQAITPWLEAKERGHTAAAAGHVGQRQPRKRGGA
jgi:AcrR family transcriptional regulator